MFAMIQNAESVPERDHSGRDRATSAIWSLSGCKADIVQTPGEAAFDFRRMWRVQHSMVLCIVISTSRVSYEGAAKEVSALVHNMMRDLQQETARQAKAVASVELGSDEIYHYPADAASHRNS
jgi:hypothetical protein